jgi:dipeptidyl-peptidase-4
VADRLSFPRQQARTHRFTLGQPRSFHVAADGSRVAFLRSPAGDDPRTALWVVDLVSAEERLVFDPAGTGPGGTTDLPPEERARRERVRESAEGVVAYGADRDGRMAAFALAGRLFVADLVGGGGHHVATSGPVLDPRPDPLGRRIAFVTDGALSVAEDGREREVVGEDDPDVTWGLPEFVAAEEMDRTRGYWWSPDGARLVVARVDVSDVRTWHIANPAHPEMAPAAVRYPAAGTPNADVQLAVVGLDGARVDLDWDRQAFPYLVRVAWRMGPPTILVQSRDQRRMRVLTADPYTGATTAVREDASETWVEVTPGVPAWLSDGRLVWVLEDEASDTRRLVLGEEPVSPPGLQVRGVVDAGERGVLFIASDEPTVTHVWHADPDGNLERLSGAPGVHGAAASGEVVVLTSATMDQDRVRTTVLRRGEAVAEIRSFAEVPAIRPVVTLASLGRSKVRSALLFPTGAKADARLPVLLDPYGGPHAQRVVEARGAFLASQWFADQGFAVLVADGRGTPGRGLAWEKAVTGDLATPALEDQVEALHAAADRDPRLDLTRVAIRGWSFGGYLAALAVLRRPDVFHAAVAGAPVTDWRLYDTHYTERYLGDPGADPDAYRWSSLLEDAAKLERPLLLIHGLVDDNVVVAHTLRLSQALMEAGRPHSVLPLSGVTHMTPQETVAENLLLLQVAFLRQALGLAQSTV